MSNLAKAHNLAERWMASVLPAAVSAAGGTGVYRHPAPEDAVEPFVTVSLMAGQAIRPLGRGNTGVERLTYDVSTWGAGNSAERANAISVAVAAAIELTGPVSVSGGQIVACTRTGPSPAPPTSIERGLTFQRDGGMYELLVKVD